jgi:hypothetical protein
MLKYEPRQIDLLEEDNDVPLSIFRPYLLNFDEIPNRPDI